jgi:hypothetical protein
MTQDIETAWITKYALTTGVYQAEVETYEDDPNMAQAANGMHQYFHGDEWHRDKSSAIAKAESMRVKKLASLKKQIARLEKVSFGEVE